MIVKTADALNAQLAKSSKADAFPDGPTHDIATTQATVKEILKHGTPDWVSHPEDYKDMAEDEFLRQKEKSDTQVRDLKMKDPEVFEDERARMRGVLSTKEFLNKLRANGFIGCVQQNKNSTPGTAGLFAVIPGQEQKGLVAVTSVQVPAMYEWSVPRYDAHGLQIGERFIGWRNSCVKLVEKGIWTEAKVHKVFGKPPNRVYTKRYFKSLWEIRNKLPASR